MLTNYKQTTVNYNYLPPNAFKLMFNGLPDVEFLVQSAPVPRIIAPSVKASTRFQQVPYDSTVLVYEPMTLSFIIDEELKSYLALYKIFKGLYGNSKEEYTLTPAERTVTLTSLTSKFNVNYNFVFTNIVPTELGEIVFNVTEPDITYLTTTLTFDYELFYIREIDTLA